MELTAEGRKLLGEKTAPFEVRYANGPIVVPGKRTDLPAYKELAVFRTELEMMDREPNVQMNGSPAIVAATHQRGRAMCISPHPEATTGLEDLVRSAVRWAAGRESTSATPLPAAAIP
jgi:phosphoribosylformylglycinamidine (FGAM) synthase-like amidotransferase family enzyme